MKVLFVEDDENKARQVVEYLAGEFPSLKLKVARSYHSGITLVRESIYDLVLLDMSMPLYDERSSVFSDDFLHYGGRDMLREMQRLEMSIKAIVVTQFGVFGEGKNRIDSTQLDEELSEEFPDTYLGMVYYNASLSNWQIDLKKLMMQHLSED